MIRVAAPPVTDVDIEMARRVLKSGNLVAGEHVAEFERRWAKYLGVRHCVCVNSGTAALHVALIAHGIGPGMRVAVGPFGFFATVGAALMVGAVPVFTDCDDRGNMDPDDPALDDVQAIVPTHYLGEPCDVEALKRHHVPVIEDAAQAHGASRSGVKAGAMGDSSCFSFYATKHITTGEGGAFCTDHDGLAEKARQIRQHGMVGRNQHVRLGYNYRMSESGAAMGLGQIDRLDGANEARRRIVVAYEAALPPEGPARIWSARTGTRNAFFWIPLTFTTHEGAMEARERLHGRGIETRYRYDRPLYDQPILGDQEPKPRAEALAGCTIGLPNRPDMTGTEINTVCGVLSTL